MALPKQESFTTGTDLIHLEAYDANWTQKNGEIQLSAADDNAFISISEAIYYWSGDAFNNDQYAQLKLVGVGVGVYNGVLGRGSAGASTGHGYYFFACSADSYLGTYDDGVWNDIGGDRGAFSAADIIRLELSGTTWTIKKNGVEITHGTDSTFSSGAGGIAGYTQAATRFDDWEGGNLAAGGGLSIPVAMANYRLQRS